MLAAVNSLLIRAFVRESSRGYARYSRRRNPGADHTLRTLRKESAIRELEELEDVDEFHDSEPDFSKLPAMHRRYEKETIERRTLIRNKTVERKYFKQTSPNLLTWSEKEQIRYLHGDDPEEWTPERLSECFPVTLENVKKIIAAHWKPATENRISRHDASALRNWRELKEGTLEGISPEMRERYLKEFSNRAIPPRRPANVQQTVHLSLGEYGKIVADRGNDEKISTNDNNLPPAVDLPKLSSREGPNSKGDKKYFTFEEMQLNIRNRIEKNQEIEENDKLIVSHKLNDNYLEPRPADLEGDISERTKNAEIEPYDIDKNILKPLCYPEYIKIPKNLWQKGKTYKVDDCYYDDDGSFLYRVPGMNSR